MPIHSPVSFDRTLFNDLSHDLDHRLDWHALMLDAIRDEIFDGTETMGELAAILFEYLARRLALEHVFLGRSLRRAREEPSRLSAEIWRYRKIQARAALPGLPRSRKAFAKRRKPKRSVTPKKP